MLARRQLLFLAHFTTLVGTFLLNFLHFVVQCTNDQAFPFGLFIWIVMTDVLQVYFCVVIRQFQLNYAIDTMRAEAYASSLISNSGVICSEDLVLAW